MHRPAQRQFHVGADSSLAAVYGVATAASWHSVLADQLSR